MNRKSILAVLCCFCLLSAAASAVEVETVTVSTIQAKNLAPVAQDLQLKTYRDVSVGGSFHAVDPEGDPITFRLVTQPLKGSVTCDGDSFLYTPFVGKRGKDSFSYEAVDSEGNVSASAQITIRMEKQRTFISYPDLKSTMLEYPAVRLAESKVFIGEQVGDVYCFMPDSVVTRGEFLTMCARLTGMEPLNSVTCTGFSDDEDISLWQKPYVSAALLYGVVQGSTDAGQVVFRADQSMTMAEAAVMLNNFLEISDTAVPGSSNAPVWAAQAVSNLNACDIGSQRDFAAGTVLTRRDAAQLLSSAMDVLDGRSEKSFSWSA